VSKCASLPLGIVRSVSQNIAGLAVQHLADAFQCVEAHALDLARLQQGNVLFGYADPFRKFLGTHLAAGEHYVEFNDDRHFLSFKWSKRREAVWGSYELPIFLGKCCGLAHDPAEYQHQRAEDENKKLTAIQSNFKLALTGGTVPGQQH